MDNQKIYGICFTDNGAEILCKLKTFLEIDTFIKKEKRETKACMVHTLFEGSLEEFAKLAFDGNNPLIFVSATGIAVRAIAPLVKSKLSDVPVLVIDELGRFVIPILSGHVGGANKIAKKVAAGIDAIPVITTATDINGTFAIDEFASQNDMKVVNKDGIKRVSAKAIESKHITISIKDYPPKQMVDVIIGDEFDANDEKLSELRLRNNQYVVGIGCKRGKSYEDIKSFFDEVVTELGINKSRISAISSIDLKENEEGLCKLAEAIGIPFVTFPAEQLNRLNGDFSGSDFVKDNVGVDNVCERSALMAAGEGGKLILRKKAKNGVTIAVALKG